MKTLYTMNDYVFFKLTDVGKKIWEEENKELKEKYPQYGWELPYFEGEWLKEQLWCLFRRFGEYANAGSDLCITEITFENPIKEKK